ncbi:MAG: hypothetical protein AMS18_02900 [Gemmatimonas sp. SG8_17]|nr:MAG: hypothetical protein AMS18_02900 [Gemmatimonas sp. SG8_17]
MPCWEPGTTSASAAYSTCPPAQQCPPHGALPLRGPAPLDIRSSSEYQDRARSSQLELPASSTTGQMNSPTLRPLHWVLFCFDLLL